ncbi:hypothetical protein ACQKMV_05770 [Lysinibacillus sp. NPDC094403]|uniref:hypothetical protein n=1 Tax=Lysinibacillus sp. NPDC094403 TaxID=3390581 RepID=UPI003D0225B5
MKIFDDKIIQDTIKTIHEPYKFNFYEDDPFTINAVISNATFSPNSSYHIHSLSLFHCGDYTKIKENSDNIYLVTSDVLETRGGKYKATLEYCNYSVPWYVIEKVLIGYDHLGRPVYEEREVLKGYIPCILKYKDFSITNNEAVNLNKPIYEITVRDNDAAKTYFKLNEDTYEDITIYDKKYRIINVDYSKQGLIRIRLEKY